MALPGSGIPLGKQECQTRPGAGVNPQVMQWGQNQKTGKKKGDNVARKCLACSGSEGLFLLLVLGVLPDEITDSASEDEHQSHHSNSSQYHFVDKHGWLLLLRWLSLRWMQGNWTGGRKN